METEKPIVKISANFANGEALFAEIKKYAQYTDDVFAYWDEFAFTVKDIAASDAVLVFNDPSTHVHILSHPEKLIAFMMEPGIRNLHPWMFKGLNRYAQVYSPLNNSSNTIPSHGYLGWYFKHNFSYLRALTVPEKKLSASCIVSDNKQLKGHKNRIQFVNMLHKQMPHVDLFGKGTNYLPDKLDGLLPYHFSIAIENTSATDYFTEKINDCFLAYTVPIYYGCKNIGKYFPAKSFISIDIEKPVEAIHTIKEAIEKNDWQDRLTALQEARQLVLHKYQPLAGAADILRGVKVSGEKQNIFLSPMPMSVKKRIQVFLKKYLEKQGRD